MILQHFVFCEGLVLIFPIKDESANCINHAAGRFIGYSDSSLNEYSDKEYPALMNITSVQQKWGIQKPSITKEYLSSGISNRFFWNTDHFVLGASHITIS
jgi:hypothetical protein